jgi:hypothetical protein
MESARAISAAVRVTGLAWAVTPPPFTASPVHAIVAADAKKSTTDNFLVISFCSCLVAGSRLPAAAV